MIIRSRWRRAGGLAAHLDRTDTNEGNRERGDLCRDCPSGTAVSLMLFSAIARTNVRATRALIHVKISPSSLLSNAQIARVIALFEAEHAIPGTSPRYVREHLRGDRPPHFHVVYPMIDPATGRAVRSHRNYFKDEVTSRRAELELGEAIVPGPRQDDVVRALRDREQHDAADLLARHQPAKRGDRVDDASRQQAVGLELDVDKIKNVVAEAWEQARGNEAAFTDRLKTRHLSIAAGSKAFLVVDEARGGSENLHRSAEWSFCLTAARMVAAQERR